MIARVWKGWTTHESSQGYQELLEKKVLPSLKKIEGYRGGWVLRKTNKDEVEFLVMNFFESLDAVRRFSGEDYSVPVIEHEARKFLSRFEPAATHYEIILTNA
jgi:heme-degrading monooxygenase HmoA